MRGRLFLAWMAVVMVSGCGSATSGSGSAAAHLTTAPDPAAARIKAAVTAFIVADAKSEETGDANPVEALTTPNSTARGNAGGFASFPIDTGTGFKTLRLDVAPSSWNIDGTNGNASVDVSWTAYGYPVTYPGDVQNGRARESKTFSDHYQLQEVGGTWLVESFS
jgi:hypothetical protein